MYTVIGAPRNRTFRVIWMLEELGEPYERVKVKQHTPEVLAHSVIGKLPVGSPGARSRSAKMTKLITSSVGIINNIRRIM